MEERFRRYTEEDRVERETASGMRHELVDGTLRAMAGGTNFHSLVIENFANILKYIYRRCRLIRHNCALRFDDANIRYPDIAIFCRNKEQIAAMDTSVSVLPQVVVEVLSPSNKSANGFSLDFALKLGLYLRSGIETLYLLDTKSREIIRYEHGIGHKLDEEYIAIEGYAVHRDWIFSEEDLDPREFDAIIQPIEN